LKGIKAHTHKYRENIIQEMIPLIKKKFGKNLVALAVQGSYARGEDHKYSDLELIAFLKKVADGKKYGGMAKIRDGMLVELLWTTKKTYLKNVKEPNEYWYISGSDTLLPIINEKYIQSLNDFKTMNLKEKCMKYAVSHFSEVHECTTKVLNAIDKKNEKGLPLLLVEMFLYMLINLSFLNKTPYVTFAGFIQESENFKIRPGGFDRLIDIIVNGKFKNLKHLEIIIIQVFNEFEKIYDKLGYEIYDDNVDPNISRKTL
jgi:predicted nucleotidyltransferase